MSYASKAKAESGGAAVAEAVMDAARIPLAPPSPRIWSPEQNAIFEWCVGGDGNLVVIARAGSGKTTTIIEGVNRMPETSILLAAFNKRIAEELNTRLNNPNAEAKTLHAIGFQLVKEYWSGVRVGKGNDRADDLTRAVCGASVPDTIKKLVSKLHTKAREMKPYAKSGADLDPLAEQFECDPDPFWYHQGYDVAFVCDRAYQAMVLAAQDRPKMGIDFADMIYLPLRNGWAAPRYTAVLVDEAQDMTLAQLDLARKVLAPGGRMCVVGDDRQAIYAFRGADSDSLSRLKKELKATQLKLTTTYRCGRKIVALAQTEVPDIVAGEGNGEGTITTLEADKLTAQAQPGDFILSRLNAPLAGFAMQLLREGKRAQIAGRDIGQGLKTLVRKLSKGVYDVDTFLDRVDAWREKEVKRLLALKYETRAVLVEDQAETLYHLADGATTIVQIEGTIERLFDDCAPDTRYVLLSSVHKAKGLEADKVFVLEWTFRRGKDQEENNIYYVAITRAKHDLVFVEARR